MSTFAGFTQEELRTLRDKAVEESQPGKINLLWTRAYQQLADAADRLEAMMARTTVNAEPDQKGD